MLAGVLQLRASGLLHEGPAGRDDGGGVVVFLGAGDRDLLAESAEKESAECWVLSAERKRK